MKTWTKIYVVDWMICGIKEWILLKRYPQHVIVSLLLYPVLEMISTILISLIKIYLLEVILFPVWICLEILDKLKNRFSERKNAVVLLYRFNRVLVMKKGVTFYCDRTYHVEEVKLTVSSSGAIRELWRQRRRQKLPVVIRSGTSAVCPLRTVMDRWYSWNRITESDLVNPYRASAKYSLSNISSCVSSLLF